jgi:hypothetical protein
MNEVEETHDVLILDKVIKVLKGIYWVWLVVCFVFWLHLFFVWTLLNPNWYSDFYRFFLFLFSGKIVSLILFFSPIFITILFLVTSIVSKTFSKRELLANLIIWSLVFCAFPNLRG